MIRKEIDPLMDHKSDYELGKRRKTQEITYMTIVNTKFIFV